jgi:predicted component of type VI protein secretion system
MLPPGVAATAGRVGRAPSLCAERDARMSLTMRAARTRCAVWQGLEQRRSASKGAGCAEARAHRTRSKKNAFAKMQAQNAMRHFLATIVRSVDLLMTPPR